MGGTARVGMKGRDQFPTVFSPARSARRLTDLMRCFQIGGTASGCRREQGSVPAGKPFCALISQIETRRAAAIGKSHYSGTKVACRCCVIEW
jgi:hypothetical protein